MAKLRSASDVPPALTKVVNQYVSRGYSRHQAQVIAFMLEAGQAVPDTPQIPSALVRERAARILLEEIIETLDALGMKLMFRSNALPTLSFDSWTELDVKIPGNFQVEDDPNRQCRLLDVVDGCTDITVSTTGLLSAMGVCEEPIQLQTNYANLDKFGPGGKRREDGKWMKPPDWQPPDHEAILRKQGWNPAKE